MIPRGRPVVDATGAANMLGMSYQTFRNRRVRADSRFPPPVNPSRRKPLYDRAQVEAYRDGRQLPALPEDAHADDLLDELDVADLHGVAPATVRADKATRRLPPPVRVYEVTHWRRGELLAARAARPGRGVGGGRPRKVL